MFGKNKDFTAKSNVFDRNIGGTSYCAGLFIES